MEESLSGKRVLVTGSGGFLGYHLLPRLFKLGARVLSVAPEGEASGDGPIERRITIREGTDLGAAVAEAAPEYIVHLGAFVSTERSLDAMRKSLEWNLNSTISLLSACSGLPVRRVVLMGTCEEYGRNAAPYSANMAPDPPSPYAASKAAITAYAKMFFNSFQLPVVVLRPSVIYGPRQSPRMLVADVMQALAAGREVAVTEGKQERDFVYAGDAADAMVRSLVSPGIEGQVLNVGSGEVVTIRDCVERIEAISGRSGLVQYGKRPYNKYEIFKYAPEVSPSQIALQWKPTTSLERGLRQTWKFVTDTQTVEP